LNGHQVIVIQSTGLQLPILTVSAAVPINLHHYAEVVADRSMLKGRPRALDAK